MIYKINFYHDPSFFKPVYTHISSFLYFYFQVYEGKLTINLTICSLRISMEESDSSPAPEVEEKVQTPPKRNRRKVPTLSKQEIEYRQSRQKYLSKLSASQTTMLFSLETSTIKLGFSNRSTQYKLDAYPQSVQTDQVFYSESGVQIPEFKVKPRFSSIDHFLRAAASTVMALLDQSTEFHGGRGEDRQLTRLNKYVTDTVPLYCQCTSSRTYALVSDPAPLGRIVVYTASSILPSYHLDSSAKASCFAIHKDGRYVVAGTESGTLLFWDLSRVEKTEIKGNSLVILPQASTDAMGQKNHRFPIVSVTMFRAVGTIVVCALDQVSNVSFWYVKINANDYSFVKAENVRLSTGVLPVFSLAMVPGSANLFLVGGGGKIYNCCRFGSATSPSIFYSQAAVKAISFSPLLTQFFAAACDNGKVEIYDMQEENPILELSINLSLGDTSVLWSPTRASVLFVSDFTGMKIYIYDLIVSTRTPVFMYKVGSAAQSISVAESGGGVILAVAEGGLAVTVYNVEDKLSKPLSNSEMKRFKLILHNSK